MRDRKLEPRWEMHGYTFDDYVKHVNANGECEFLSQLQVILGRGDDTECRVVGIPRCE